MSLENPGKKKSVWEKLTGTARAAAVVGALGATEPAIEASAQQTSPSQEDLLVQQYASRMDEVHVTAEEKAQAVKNYRESIKTYNLQHPSDPAKASEKNPSVSPPVPPLPPQP